MVCTSPNPSWHSPLPANPSDTILSTDIFVTILVSISYGLMPPTSKGHQLWDCATLYPLRDVLWRHRMHVLTAKELEWLTYPSLNVQALNRFKSKSAQYRLTLTPTTGRYQCTCLPRQVAHAWAPELELCRRVTHRSDRDLLHMPVHVQLWVDAGPPESQRAS
jgi:hypothetical protein